MSTRARSVPVTPTREALRKAIATRADARKKVEVAREREVRGRELLQDAERKLGAFDNVDADIVKLRAGRFRKAATTTGAAPDAKLPDDLIARRQQRDEAREIVEGATAAHQSLKGDLTDAESALGAAEKLAGNCASEILAEKGAALATELQAAWSRVWALQDEVTALGSITQLPPNALSTIAQFAALDHRQFAGGRNGRLMESRELWRKRHQALCANADFEEFDGVEASAVERAA